MSDSINSNIARLGVNVDHVATLRKQRDELYPSVESAARVALEAGADQITIHLREDRRHIQDSDVPLVRAVTSKFGRDLNFEMGCTEEMVDIAILNKPDWICLVPEKREEKTTEGGLDLGDKNIAKVERCINALKQSLPQTKISLFVEADTQVMRRSIELGADAVEIHTGSYAIDFLKNLSTQKYLDKFRESSDIIASSSLNYHAGHGLTDQSVVPLLKQGLFAEYNIGHWMICQSVFDGLSKVTSDLLAIMNKYPTK